MLDAMLDATRLQLRGGGVEVGATGRSPNRMPLVAKTTPPYSCAGSARTAGSDGSPGDSAATSKPRTSV
jgi:hypothetical protein